MAHKNKPKYPSLPFGTGIVYLLIYVPNVLAVKIGYTGRSVKSRVAGTSKAVFGFTVPIGFIIVPFAWHVEQMIHAMLSGLRYRFYKGDGHTETFFLPAVVFVYPLFAVVWWMEIKGVGWLVDWLK